VLLGPGEVARKLRLLRQHLAPARGDDVRQVPGLGRGVHGSAPLVKVGLRGAAGGGFRLRPGKQGVGNKIGRGGLEAFGQGLPVVHAPDGQRQPLLDHAGIHEPDQVIADQLMRVPGIAQAAHIVRILGNEHVALGNIAGGMAGNALEGAQVFRQRGGAKLRQLLPGHKPGGQTRGRLGHGRGQAAHHRSDVLRMGALEFDHKAGHYHSPSSLTLLNSQATSFSGVSTT